MIELREVRLRYDPDGPPLLDGVDLSVGEGELVLVSGRTGGGKSTLLGVLTGLVPRFTGGVLSGDVRWEGRSILRAPPRERAHLIGHVGQDPAAGFVTDTVEAELAYGMEQLGIDPATMRRRVEETLDLLGIADLRDRDLRTLSGGQQQRVAIGSVLTMHPRLLVLDEPTSALDPTAAEDVLATLARLVEDLGVSVVLAEHRLERVLGFVDRMVLLPGDGTLREGPVEQVIADSPVVPPIVELGRTLGWQKPELTVRGARRRLRTDPAVLAEPTPRDHESGERSSRAAAGRGGLTARGLTVRHGTTVAVREVDLDLPAGTVTALMGRNGSGKSSAIWALQGTGRRRTGSVVLTAADGTARDPAESSPAERRAAVGLVPQSAADLLFAETVDQECAAADHAAGQAADHAAGPGGAGRCRALLDRIAPGIDPATHPRDLSEGQRLALVLAIVLCTEPPVVLLDEPTRGLDYPAKSALGAVLRGLAADGHAILVASHDVEFVAQVADRAVVMAQGEVVAAGPVSEVLAQSPAYAPQIAKILGPPWLTADQVRRAMGDR